MVKILDRLAKLKQIAQSADMYVHRMDQMDSIATYQKYLDQGNVVMVLDFKFEVGESRSQPYGDNGQIETGLDYYVSSKRMKCKFTNWTVSAMDANCIQN